MNALRHYTILLILVNESPQVPPPTAPELRGALQGYLNNEHTADDTFQCQCLKWDHIVAFL